MLAKGLGGTLGLIWASGQLWVPAMLQCQVIPRLTSKLWVQVRRVAVWGPKELCLEPLSCLDPLWGLTSS